MKDAWLSNPELYINRELSFLEVNRRILAQAKDNSVPLLERLRFLGLACSVLDEFFEIRVAGLKQHEAYGAEQRGPDNMTPSELLRSIADVVRQLVDEQYRVLNDVLLPKLDIQGIRILARKNWNEKQARWLKRFFNRELAPIMNPIGLDPAHPFPEPLNKSLTFIVTLEGADAFGRRSGKAIVQAPRALSRVVRLPESCAQPADRAARTRLRMDSIDHVVHGGGGVPRSTFRGPEGDTLHSPHGRCRPKGPPRPKRPYRIPGTRNAARLAT